MYFLKTAHAYTAWNAGKSFSIRLQFKGWNPKRSCVSDCWWMLTFGGNKKSPVCTFGKTGSSGGKSINMDFQDAINKAHEKLASGYVYDSGTLAGPLVIQADPTPVHLTPDTWKDRAFSATPPVRKSFNPLELLPAPFNGIRELKKNPTGDWAAYDEKGAFLLKVPEETAQELLELLRGAA